MDDKITAALAGPDGTIPSSLAPVRDAVLAVDNPRSGHVWMRSPAVEVLTRIASGELPLTHEALDGLRQTASLVHLRDLLVSLGLLPSRDPLIARIEGAIARRAAELSGENSKILRSFGTWSVMRGARRKADLKRLTINGAQNAVAEIHEAARFLSWLEDEGELLSELTQADVETWLSHRAKARYKLRGFVIWASRRKLCPELDVPVLGTGEGPSGPVDHEARWALARRLLHDDTIDPGDRVAGALVVIYAQRLSNIARLTRSDVAARDDETFVRLGKEHSHAGASGGPPARSPVTPGRDRGKAARHVVAVPWTPGGTSSASRLLARAARSSRDRLPGPAARRAPAARIRGSGFSARRHAQSRALNRNQVGRVGRRQLDQLRRRSGVDRAGRTRDQAMTGFILLAGAAVTLVVGAELFTENASAAGRRLGVSLLAVGLVLAGAEPEELFTAIIAAARERPLIAAGDALGANITMLTLVLGLGTLLRPLPFGRRVRTYAVVASAGGVGRCFPMPLSFVPLNNDHSL